LREEDADSKGGIMERIMKLYVRLSETAIGRVSKGQTMTEYGLLLSAVGIVVYSGYKTMGTVIKSLLVTVDGQL
jgi:Flp pilus assembly pilin Flp